MGQDPATGALRQASSGDSIRQAKEDEKTTGYATGAKSID